MVGRRLLHTVTASIFAGAGVLTGLAAQTTPPCRGAGEGSAALLRWVTRIATGTDRFTVEDRERTKIPAVPAGDIVYVTDTSVCRRLVPAYDAVTGIRDVTTGRDVPGSGQLYVVRAGPVYVATDPAKQAGEFGFVVILDSLAHVLYHSLY